MSDKKNIDRLFQECFKDFEAIPNDAVWNNIEAKLQQKNKKHKVIPIWWRYVGIAALLLLLLTVGNSFLDDTTNIIPSNNVVDTQNTTRSSTTKTNENKTTISVTTDVNPTKNNDNSISNKNVSNSSLKNEFSTGKNEAIVNHSDEDTQLKNNGFNQDKLPKINTGKPKLNIENKVGKTTYIAKNLEKNNYNLPEKESKLPNSEEGKPIHDNNPTTIANTQPKEDNQVAENLEKNKEPSIEDFLKKTEEIIEEEKQLNRWSLTPNAAPVYFNTLSEGSSIGGQFNNNSKTAEANMSYGISASYAVNNKLSIRSGINKVNLGYNTNNVVVFETLSKSSSSSLLSNVKASSQNANALENVALVSGDNFESNEAVNLTSNSKTSINQSFGYIEVPLEIQYNLLNKKLGVNLIGGFSSFFLSDNELFSEVEGNRTPIGEATNINNISYSANFGLGFQYKFTKKLNLNLEPMFKYQIKTFNNTSGNFTPYFIGVYTGIGFKF
ncbi:hypothetical protein APS56_10585 [Pseudalgibacter alginicilyticus]|uniref:Outer membrane protein beta-barrel domain-containing protein n=1 Tax=Pseudalgibacter alginicilyticus TaxID=1736674 RepID=A0A0P0CY41_9FLAO|nr:hypothetical protein [Pseudalgibacter alginicilyticus]ALJ05539.1 hypothetical protein APS56_10585 [Pseudalgibacter alginicilyticus]